MENSAFVSNMMTSTTNSGRTLSLQSPMLRGDDVRWVQQRIGAVPDGIFGPKTESKLKAFQLANFLLPSGVVDASTMLKLSQVTVTGGGGSSGSGGSSGVPATTTPVTGDSRKRWIYLGVGAIGVGVAYAYYKKS